MWNWMLEMGSVEWRSDLQENQKKSSSLLWDQWHLDIRDEEDVGSSQQKEFKALKSFKNM